jgi:hypothetical protein
MALYYMIWVIKNTLFGNSGISVANGVKMKRQVVIHNQEPMETLGINSTNHTSTSSKIQIHK